MASVQLMEYYFNQTTCADVNIRFQESSYITSEDSLAVIVCTVIDGVAAGGVAQDISVLITNVPGQTAGLQ